KGRSVLTEMGEKGRRGGRERPVEPAYHKPLAHDREADDIERDEAAVGNLGSDRIARKEGDAETRHHRLLDRLIAADLGAGPQSRHLDAGKERVERRSCARPLLADEEPLARES